MLEYNWTRVLYKRLYAITRVFLLCQCLKKYIFKKKKKDDQGFLSYTKHYLSTINQQQMIWLLRLGLVKNFTCSYKKADFSVIVNIKYLHVCMFYFFHFFKIIIVHLFLARHDQHFIMFINSNVFEFANFPFKRKYNNTAVYSANSNYLFSWGKQEKKLLKRFFD